MLKLLHRCDRDALTEDDTEGEVGLRELLEGEDHESDERSALEQERSVVGILIDLELRGWVGNDGQLVPVAVTHERLQRMSQAHIGDSFPVEMPRLSIKLLELLALDWNEIHFPFF